MLSNSVNNLTLPVMYVLCCMQVFGRHLQPCGQLTAHVHNAPDALPVIPVPVLKHTISQVTGIQMSLSV